MRSVAAARIREYQLHTFCDASEEAFAAVCYLRYTLDDGQVLTSHVAAKMRVAPFKPVTIPRLELQAAVLGSRLATMVKEEHNVEIAELIFWTDSRTVLHWLRADAHQFKPFVAHRVGEISELTNTSQWRWVPTLSNPADAATREKGTISPFDTFWLHGPPFLRENEEKWPAEYSNAEDDPDLDCQAELKKEFVNIATAKDSRDPTVALPSIAQFSSWSKLVRTTARVLMFIRLLKDRVRNPQRRQQSCAAFLLLSEVREAQRLWMLKSQADSFSAEIVALQSEKPLDRNSRLLTLSPTIEDGLLKVAGRTDNASCMSSAAKSPVILDPHHPYTCLLLMQYHRWNGHHGRERMLNDMRQRSWILQMRSAVKKTWTTCQLCKVNRASPATPEMGQLPSARLAARARPFTHAGVDYFGPTEVMIGRRREKRYGVIFTCLTIRAVHLEIANSLTTDSCIMAIRRFIARRGYPAAMYSDNGTSFHGAHRELKRALKDLDHERLAAELLTKEIEWHFNPPAAPHMGGAWEQLVRSIKIALNTSLKERSPREEVLATVFAEAEYLINSRPLTHVSVDPSDPESLTPNHFLLGESQAVTCPGVFDSTDLHLRKSWQTAQAIANMYWRRWVREYLPQLTKRTRWHQHQSNLKVGDIVVIIDDKMPRGSWPKGTITATHPGKDGVTRVVDVQTKDAEHRSMWLYHRVCDSKLSEMETTPKTCWNNQTLSTFLAVIGRRFADAGLQDLLVESDVGLGATTGVFSGKHYNRALRAHTGR